MADLTVHPRHRSHSTRFEALMKDVFREFPWTVRIRDCNGNTFKVGKGKQHWCKEPLSIHLKTENAMKKVLTGDALGFLEKFVEGEVAIEGNIYVLPFLKHYGRFGKVKWGQWIASIARNSLGQSARRTASNVKSHYDIPQEALDVYLDRVYRSYSCGIFENPLDINKEDLLLIGRGKEDTFDSLEKAQWRKFKDAVDFLNPRTGETMIDIGCGYGGQLAVALEEYPFGNVVGWTHSENQVRVGRQLLSGIAKDRWEIHEGDYREETRTFDHVTSMGMISHVGPRGLAPYVRRIRRMIRTGGRYVHHAIMGYHHAANENWSPGTVFNKKYVWPGFHWFTVGEHATVLDKNGFAIRKMVNLGDHYTKTTAAWYLRMMQEEERMIHIMGEQTFRAWRIYLGGAPGAFQTKEGCVCRFYCEAV